MESIYKESYKNTKQPENECDKELESFANDYGLTIKEAKEVIFAFHMTEFKKALGL